MAALLPNISLSGQTTWNEYYQLGELQNEYNSFSQAARISQPLLRLDTWFNFRRSKFLTDASEADFAFQQQNLIVRTAELYFNVLRSIDNLNAAISEEVAIKKQLDQTKQRYEVGLSAITEVQEAQLAYDVSLAAKIRREGEVFTAREALNALVGREIVSVDALVNEMRVTNPVPDSKDDWVQKGIENNFRLKAANLRTKLQKIMLGVPRLIICLKLILLVAGWNQKLISFHSMALTQVLLFKLLFLMKHKEIITAFSGVCQSFKVELLTQDESKLMQTIINPHKMHFLFNVQ